jgi:hypothetical protein
MQPGLSSTNPQYVLQALFTFCGEDDNISMCGMSLSRRLVDDHFGLGATAVGIFSFVLGVAGIDRGQCGNLTPGSQRAAAINIAAQGLELKILEEPGSYCLPK